MKARSAKNDCGNRPKTRAEALFRCVHKITQYPNTRSKRPVDRYAFEWSLKNQDKLRPKKEYERLMIDYLNAMEIPTFFI